VLTLTDNATSAIRTLTAQPEAPDGCGLRIASDPAAGGLTLAVAQSPQDGDQVIDNSGARVFVDEQAAMMLDDKALDAAVDEGGRVQFAVAPQPGAAPV
jgi:Fe-S cluster assembly iron-binding protein IscA